VTPVVLRDRDLMPRVHTLTGDALQFYIRFMA
jgi:hypothetical protein